MKKKVNKKTVKKVVGKKTINKKPNKEKSVSKKFLKRKSIQKKSKVIKRVSTGIENLNSLIQGGFEDNSTNLLVGEIGSGKSILITQFLVESAKKGEKVLFINFEEKKNEFYANMRSLGFDLEDLEKKGLFFFLEYTPQKVKTMLEEGGGEIEAIVLNHKIKRIAIDSMTSFMMLFKGELEKKEAALSLFGLIRSWNCTSLLSYGVSSSDGPKVLELEADSIIQLFFVRSLFGRKRYIEVIKMRGTSHSLNLHEMKIGLGGINVQVNPVKKVPKFIAKAG